MLIWINKTIKSKIPINVEVESLITREGKEDVPSTINNSPMESFFGCYKS